MSASIRLLLCNDCKTIDEVPDFEGPVEYDHELEYVAGKHRTPGGTEHRGNLVKIPVEVWAKTDQREEVLKQIRAALKGEAEGLGGDFYNLRNTLGEDALKCFTKHQRNPMCSDYKSDRMLLTIGQDVKDMWKDVGVRRPDNMGPKRYLCEHCPVHSLVQQAARDKHGLSA